MDKKSPETNEVPLSGNLAGFREALKDEISKVKSSGLSSLVLRSGYPVESRGNSHWYRFVVEYSPSIPSDTPCKLKVGTSHYDVTVVSVEDNTIIISSEEKLPDNIGYAQLENGSTVLMERLIKCIEDNSVKENPIGNCMLTSDESVYRVNKIFDYKDLSLKPGNTDSQSNAIEQALANDITYIWGPPGTGKTTVIGQIIDELFKHDRSVLVVSHTNTAVDGAIVKADKSYSASNKGVDSYYPILRIGTPARTIPEKALLDSHVKALGKELYEQKKSLEDEQFRIEEGIRDLRVIINKDLWLSNSQLNVYETCTSDIASLVPERDQFQDKLDEIDQAIKDLANEYPEYNKYLSLQESMDARFSELEKIKTDSDEADRTIAELSPKINNAKDEIKKCDIYYKLKSDRDSSYMSEEFYRKKLTECSAQLKDISEKIDKLENESRTVIEDINAYERRGAVGRLFANNYQYQKNKDRVAEIVEETAALNEESSKISAVSQKHQQKLEELLVLNKELESYIPSNTKEVWQDLLQQYENKVASCKSTLVSLTDRKDSLKRSIEADRLELETSKKAYERIESLNQEFRSVSEQLSDIQKRINQLCNKQKHIIEAEKALCASFHLMKSSLLEDQYAELSSLIKAVEKELEDVDIVDVHNQLDNYAEELAAIAAQLSDINRMLSDLERQAIFSAKIIGTTLAKSYLDATLRERTFDTVILDEASMASIPALWCASYLAEKSIVIVGDFLQLPPIVMAETEAAIKWLGTDIFKLSGMQDLAKNKATCPSNFVMLNDQFRMEPDIADIANMYYGRYGGLRSNDYTEQRINDREEFKSWYSGKVSDTHVHLIDTESLNAWATGVPQGKGASRLNSFSAAVDVELAFKCIENIISSLDPTTAKPFDNAKVLIVAPYRPHIKLVNQLIEFEYKSRGLKNLGLVRAGTIHSFQGSEAEIVIFDTVLDDPHWKANLFLPDDYKNTGKESDTRKLFNVAITRAKFELFVVGDFKFLQAHAKNNALSELLDKLINKMHLRKIDAKKLLPNLTYTRPASASVNKNLGKGQVICKETDFMDLLKKDIASFKTRMIIYSPFMTLNRLADLRPHFADAINAGKTITVITKSRSDRGKRELPTYIECEKGLKDLGIEVIHKKGMHEKLIFVDSSAVWIGSLNALSFSGQTGEVMHRIGDKAITAEYEKLYDISHIESAVINDYERTCPICGSEMILRESDNGGSYWACVEGDYSRNMDQQYPLDGILRCSCGAPYKFFMKNEPRWVCSENPKGHQYKKMRYSDLKLEKMYALIPRNERKAVKEYFAEKQSEKKKAEANKKKKSTKSKKKSKKKSNSSSGGEQLTLL